MMESEKFFMGLFSKLCPLFILCFVVGCSGDVKVTGKASFSDGTPLPRGMIVIADDKAQFTGDIIDGNFTMGGVSPKSGMPPGKYKVFVTNCNTPEGTSLVKKDFLSAETTPLTLEVVKGKNPPLDLKFEKP